MKWRITIQGADERLAVRWTPDGPDVDSHTALADAVLVWLRDEHEFQEGLEPENAFATADFDTVERPIANEFELALVAQRIVGQVPGVTAVEVVQVG